MGAGFQARGGSFGGGGTALSRGPIPRDVAALLVFLFTTFVFQFFQWTSVIPGLLRLGPMVFKGALWQLISYAFTGFGPASLWFLLSLLILYWFGSDVFLRLGRRLFWRTLLSSILIAGVVGVAVRGVGILLGRPSPFAFVLMQGQYMLISILIAAYATLYSSRSILLFFVLPIRASWFLWLEILFAFMGFLNTHDFAGFVGISSAVAATWLLLQPGGPGRGLRDLRLRLRRLWIEIRLARLRRNRNLHIIDDDERRPN